MKSERIHTFNGLKEQIYIADYVPEENFTRHFPFRNYILVRAESGQNLYTKNKNSLVRQILIESYERNINVVFLPRYESDKLHAKGLKNIYIPPNPMNGLDLCYHSDAVLTGSGTLAREAACLGIPAVSFFPDSPINVDKYLIQKSKLLQKIAVKLLKSRPKDI